VKPRIDIDYRQSVTPRVPHGILTYRMIELYCRDERLHSLFYCLALAYIQDLALITIEWMYYYYARIYKIIN
jgi:hypothetical protein